MKKFNIFVMFVMYKFAVAEGDSEDFMEVDARRMWKGSQVKFGAGIYTDYDVKLATQIKKIGPVFRLAYWQVVSEVSGAAPAPHDADDERMDAWVYSAYYYQMPDFDYFQNTSNLLRDKNVDLVAATVSPPNSYFNTLAGIKKFKEISEAIKKGETIEKPKDDDQETILKEITKENRDDSYPLLMEDSITDFAKFWAASIVYLHNNKLTLPFIELTWEPDVKAKDGVYFLPEDYVSSVKSVRREMRNRGIEDDKNRLVGPGTSSPSAAKEYIEAFAKDREAYDTLHSWSIHIRDEGGSMEEIEKELLTFKQILKSSIPESWPKKPVIITSFKYQPPTNLVFGDVTFNGDLDACYTKLYGRHQTSDDDIPNTIAQYPPTGVRLLANLILQYSLGFSQSIYRELSDANWSHSCLGLYDRLNRKKQLLVAFTSFLKYIPAGAKVVKKQWQNRDNCVPVVLKSKTRLITAIANPNDAPCSRSFSFTGIPTKNIGEGFTVSYNNGTVSLAARDGAEALITKLPLDYDVFDEDNIETIEFDIVIGPHASVTAVIDLVQTGTSKATDQPKPPAHQEL